MFAAFLLSFREGVEAALIVGILLGYLRRAGRWRARFSIFWGVLGACLASLVAGLALLALGVEFEGVVEEVFEGGTMLLAAGLLTWAVLWMRRRDIRGELERRAGRSVSSDRGWGLFTLAFVTVFREGLELALFLVATIFTSSAIDVLLGGLLGIGIAVLIGWFIFASTTRLNIKRFFQVTSVLLVIFAAGLVAQGLHELGEAGLIPMVIEHLWDTNRILDEHSTVGSILKSLLGYNGDPSLIEVLGYVGYYLLIWGVARLDRARKL